VWRLSPEIGKNGVRVSRYFQRNSNGATKNTIKFVIKSIDRYRNLVVSDGLGQERKCTDPTDMHQSGHLNTAVCYRLKCEPDFLGREPQRKR